MSSLYLRRYINQTKGDENRLLQGVRGDQDWEPWVLYMLRGVAATSRQTAMRYLDALADSGVLTKARLGRENDYINNALVSLLFELPELELEE